MKFYDCAPAPSPRRVRIFIAEKGLTDRIETVQVDLRNGEHMKPEFLRINPWRSVPVIETDDGTFISESIACCRYLEAKFPDPPLMGATAEEQGVIAMWEHRCEWDGFLAAAEVLRNAAPGMRDRGWVGPVNHEQIPALVERGGRRVQHFFAVLDERLGQSKFVATDAFTVADITALISVDFARRQKFEWPESYKNLARWHAEVSARPSAKL